MTPHLAPVGANRIGMERCIDLWSVKGETVLTPFLGIGIELKPSYFKQAVENIAKAGHRDAQAGMFEAA